MFTEGSGYGYSKQNLMPDTGTFRVNECIIIIHMLDKSCFNEFEDHHRKLFFTEIVDMHFPYAMAEGRDSTYTLTLLDITVLEIGLDDEWIELVFKTNRSIPQISSCHVKDALLDYMYKLAQKCGCPDVS